MTSWIVIRGREFSVIFDWLVTGTAFCWERLSPISTLDMSVKWLFRVLAIFRGEECNSCGEVGSVMDDIVVYWSFLCFMTSHSFLVWRLPEFFTMLSRYAVFLRFIRLVV